MPYQMDWQSRAPYPGTSDGYYYWTNAWILNAHTDGEAITQGNRVANWVIANSLTDCQRVRRTYKRSPGRAGVYLNQSLLNLPGTYPSGTAGWSLLWSIRIDFFAAGKVVGYKRWRMPVRYDQVNGSEVDDGLINDLADGLDTLMGFNCLAAIDGTVITNYNISPVIRQWQLRHGTERRDRVVIA